MKKTNRKKQLKSVEIEFSTSKKSIIRSAEVTNYLSRLASYHYKCEVINEINGLLTKGIAPKDIFILSESFKFDHAYRFLNDVSIKNNRVYSLLNIGLPLPLLPNEDLIRLNLAYQILNYLYDISSISNEFGYRRNWFWNNYKICWIQSASAI